MKSILFLIFLFVSLLFTGCIEIIDDLSFNLDGSGTFKYSVNLSSSKTKVNSILALDSLEGKKVPSKDEIALKIEEFKQKLERQEGITNVEIESDFTNYLFKLKCSFKNIESLQTGIKNVIGSFSEKKEYQELKHNWVFWEGSQLVRSIPEITTAETKKISGADIELLKQGVYTSITRFQSEVNKFDNSKAVLSKNKMAVLIKTDPNTLINKPNVLENRIYLSK